MSVSLSDVQVITDFQFGNISVAMWGNLVTVILGEKKKKLFFSQDSSYQSHVWNLKNVKNVSDMHINWPPEHLF